MLATVIVIMSKDIVLVAHVMESKSLSLLYKAHRRWEILPINLFLTAATEQPYVKQFYKMTHSSK